MIFHMTAVLAGDKGRRETSRPLNLPVSDEFDAAQENAQFEADALAAWEEYQLNGVHVTSKTVDGMFSEALERIRSAAKS